MIESFATGPETRILQTSAGRVRLTIHRPSRWVLGLWVSVTLFDDDGWERVAKGWMERTGVRRRGVPLAAFLAETIAIDLDAAARLSEKVMSEWHERGGVQASRREARWVQLVIVGLAFVAALALFGLFAAVWLLV
jgi:hypothetical protein